MTDTSGTQGQESGNQQGGAQGQESGANGNGQGQESGQQGNNQQQGQQGSQPDLSAITDPNLRAWVETQARQAAEARQEAARYRTERNTYQQQVTEFQRQNETADQAAQREAQERQTRLEQLEQENRTLKVNGRVETAAVTAKAHNPALVTQMLAGRVELDDQGNPTNLDSLLNALRTSDPYLFKRSTQDAGQGRDGDGEPQGNMNDRIRGLVAARRTGGRG